MTPSPDLPAMRRSALILVAVLALAMWAATPVRGATFPINYSDPASDVVRLNSTTGLCEVVPGGGNCIMSPDPHDVNIQWLRGREAAGAAGASYNLTIQVVGQIRDYANTSYVVNLYTDATNATHWVANYTNGVLLLYQNGTGAQRTDISGNATVWGPNPTTPSSLSLSVDKALLGGPANISSSVNIDATAIMRGDPALGQWVSYQDFGWEEPGRPATSPTLLRGHVYARGTTTAIGGATVAASGGPSVLTNATGFYELGLTPGTFSVTVSADGYAAATFSVNLTLGQTLTRDVELDRTAGILPGSLLPIAILVAAFVAVLAILAVLSWRKRKPAEPRKPDPPA